MVRKNKELSQQSKNKFRNKYKKEARAFIQYIKSIRINYIKYII